MQKHSMTVCTVCLAYCLETIHGERINVQEEKEKRSTERERARDRENKIKQIKALCCLFNDHSWRSNNSSSNNSVIHLFVRSQCDKQKCNKTNEKKTNGTEKGEVQWNEESNKKKSSGYDEKSAHRPGRKRSLDPNNDQIHWISLKMI